MLEFVLIAVLHLDGDVLGPSTLIDIYPTEQLCIERASDGQDIVDQLQYEWYEFRSQNPDMNLPVVLSIGMFCKPMYEVEENSI